MFGDIPDTFLRFGEIDFSDLGSTEENTIGAICIEWPDSESFGPEGIGDSPEPPLEADVAFRGGNRSDDFAAVVDGLGQLFGEWAWRWSITARRYGHADALMRSLIIIGLAPLVEGSLSLTHAVQESAVKDLCLEAAMEAFVLAPALRVIGTGVDGVDPKLEQPDA